MSRHLAIAAISSCLNWGAWAHADPLAWAERASFVAAIFEQVLREPGNTRTTTDVSMQTSSLAPRLRRQVVDYPSHEPPGTIIVDTANTYLYYVLGGGEAIRYGIGVGREGFTWSGVQSIAHKAEWPDWTPPASMLARQPYLPRIMAGGPGNPLGARALYLGGTLYRIHGTNQPATIGGHASSGCIRMTNADVIDLYDRVTVGTKVIVLPAGPHHSPENLARTPSAPLAVSLSSPSHRSSSLN